MKTFRDEVEHILRRLIQDLGVYDTKDEEQIILKTDQITQAHIEEVKKNRKLHEEAGLMRTKPIINLDDES